MATAGTESIKSVRDLIGDFDAIATALESAPPRETLSAAERALLRQVRTGALEAVDVGCGDGVFARAMARRGARVLAIDLSPRMIAVAQARTSPDLCIQYRVANIMTAPLPSGAFDVVVSVNMVHHMPLPQIVPRLADAVAPGGLLLIQDVVDRPHPRYFVVNVVAALGLRARRVVGAARHNPVVAALYEKHGKGETYLTPGEVAAAYATLLPGARIEHHLEWRYSITWSRPRGHEMADPTGY
jgi:SAM-dependent methyltransferase